jgi:UDP-N-acetylmuramoylalanine--D-glutamate ligase
MKIKDLQGKLVAVLGYGIEGRAVTRYLLKNGLKPVLFDQKPWQEWQKKEQDLIKCLDINFIFGPDCFKELTGFDFAFRSPGVKFNQLPASDCKMTSQTKWFFEHCPAKIIGVTGTKGKGTTSTLIYEILKKQISQPANKLISKAFLTGNIDKEQPLDFLDDIRPDDWIVYELSSFQLQDLTQSPHIGVVLMVTSEHLDYHKDNQEYIEAKSPISKFQNPNDFTVINADFENSVIIGEQGEGRKLYFSRKGVEQADCYVDGNNILLKDLNLKINVSDLTLKGRHNLENISAAILAASSVGCPENIIEQVVLAFKGLEHRLEFVAEKNGIKFYNDSFSTTPETAIAAIKSFVEPEILILGGASKNSDFAELGKTITEAENIKAIIFVGPEGDRIEKEIEALGGFKNFVLKGAKNITEIFEQIRSVSQQGDLVLLSPACTSFDMFENYKDRGEQFKKEVLKFK